MTRKKSAATLSLQAYERIRNRILTGECPLGSPLSRRRFAEELGMSLIPVSEALQRLESEGLVESKPRAGTRVRVPTTEDIRGHYIVREALESQSARLFAKMATKEQKTELREMAEYVDKLAAITQKVEAPHRYEASFEFERMHLRLHTRVAECSECSSLVDAIERSRVLINNWLFNVSVDIEPLPATWHRDLIKTLSNGDPLEADAAMRRHVTFRQEKILARFEQFQASPEGGGRYQRMPSKSRSVA